jgi:hypothetical protein
MYASGDIVTSADLRVWDSSVHTEYPLSADFAEIFRLRNQPLAIGGDVEIRDPEAAAQRDVRGHSDFLDNPDARESGEMDEEGDDKDWASGQMLCMGLG